MSFDKVRQHMDPNKALTVWYKLFMNEVRRHMSICYKQVKLSLSPWLNKNIIQAISDWDGLKKECSWNIKPFFFFYLVRSAKKLYYGARHRRNSKKVLRRSRKDTVPGPDRIQYWDIKNLTEEDRAELYTIYQESFDKGYIPKDWTDTFLRPIPKPRMKKSV